MGHCATCASYEATLMDAPVGQPPRHAGSPCPDYVMSDAMRDWLVAAMRREVAGQVGASGLDRMAVVGSRQEPDRRKK